MISNIYAHSNHQAIIFEFVTTHGGYSKGPGVVATLQNYGNNIEGAGPTLVGLLHTAKGDVTGKCTPMWTRIPGELVIRW